MNITEELQKASKSGGENIHEVYRKFKGIIEAYAATHEPFDFPMNNLVLVGGGSGVSTVGRALYGVGLEKFTSIASVSDVGGGSGIVQEAFGIPHMNDLAQHLLNMNPKKNALAQFMSLRTSREWRQDGYLVLSAVIEILGAEKGVDLINHCLENVHRPLPVTATPCEPIFTYCGGRYRTHEFAFLKGKTGAAEHVAFDVPVNILPESDRAIRHADIAIVGPGDVHFSVLPPMLARGFFEALNVVSTVILVANLTARDIDIPGFTLKRFLDFWERYLPPKPKYHVLVNTVMSGEQECPTLDDDVHGDHYGGFCIHRALIAGHGMSRNQQRLHDEVALGKSLKRLIVG